MIRAPVAGAAALLAALCAGCPSADPGPLPYAATATVDYQVDDGCGGAGEIELVGEVDGTMTVSGAEWCGLPSEAEALVPAAAKNPNAGGWRLHGTAHLCATATGSDAGGCTSWTQEWRLCTATAVGGVIQLPCLDYQDNVVCTATLTPDP
jgi:hypothetical protein